MQRFARSLVFLALVCMAGEQASAPEHFDISGMPSQPSTFAEQQIHEMIRAYSRGNLAEAARIQRKLGRYYADKGDQKRAAAAYARADAAEEALRRRTSLPLAQEHSLSSPSTSTEIGSPAAAGSQLLSGNYYGYAHGALHTWDFSGDGTFLHTWIASSSGSTIRNSERGRFRVAGSTLELTIQSAAGGYATEGVGGRTIAIGGGSASATEVRRLPVRFLPAEKAIVLDGIKLKPKSW